MNPATFSTAICAVLVSFWWAHCITSHHHHHLPFFAHGTPTQNHAAPSNKHVADFVPLSCNKDLINMDSKSCTCWSNFFEHHPSTFASRVVIPCGVCVILTDHSNLPDGDDSSSNNKINITLNFLDGLDIQGKLVVVPGHPDVFITIRSTLIVVQGELVVDTTTIISSSSRSSSNQQQKGIPIDGNPRVNFVLLAAGSANDQEQQQWFEPVGENALACDHGNQPCHVGSKAFVVAGGAVHFQGLPLSLDDKSRTWVPLQRVVMTQGAQDDMQTTPLSSSILVVEDTVPWGVGAEVLVTSHTRAWDGHQVRTIANIAPHPRVSAWVQLTLDAPLLHRPTTRQDNRDMAVEVALLSRSIRLESEQDGDGDGSNQPSQHGGHFIILNTPNVVQSIVGVEFDGLGQQGCLGRYPLHFHFCGNSTGSVVAKNTIRGSHQRCVVVHGTDHLTVADNVAFDTKGHCFVLEDGIETYNKFFGNLGVQTGRPDTVIPNLGSNGNETDQFIPSTFWISNPLNIWEDNVAAGSEGAGFWFELRKRGTRAHLFDLDPKTASLGRFKNNVAHSNAEKGFRTYPSGYLPDTQQVFKNLKAYRNGGAGVFLHITRNVKIDGLLASDNKHVGIDIDRADAITISDSTIIGASDSYVDLMNTQGVDGVCHQDRLHGIELHTWKHDQDEMGATIIENVVFQGFDSKLICPNGSLPFHLDKNTRTTQFDAYTSIEGVSVVPNRTDPIHSDQIDFCEARNANVVNIYITDLDGSLAPFSTSKPSTLLSLHPIMHAFVDSAQCQDNKRRCYSYCNNTCFRTARFSIDPANTENNKLKVCKRGDSPSCIEILGYRTNQETFTKRVFVAHLPRGSYDAMLLDRFGSATWPSFVDMRLEVALCPTAFSDDDIHLNVPEAASDECNQLVRNGRMEKSDVEAKHWLSRFGSLLLAVGKGVDGTNALTGPECDADITFVQYIDSRCLKMEKGRFYELSADIKLTFSNDKPWICNPNKRAGNCPEIGVYTNEQGYLTVAVVEPEAGIDGFQRAFGFFQVQDHMVSATNVMLFVRSNVDNRIMYVDNISMTLVPNEQKFCKNVILHSDMENEDWLEVWEIEGSGLLRKIQGPIGANPTQPALRFGDRREFSDAVSYTGWRDVETACFKPGSTWKVVGQFQLYSKSTRRPEECNLEKKECPAVRLIIKDASRERIFIDKVREYTKSTWTANAFNRFEATFALPSDIEWDGGVGKIVLQILDFPVELDLIVGSIVMKPEPASN